MIKHVYLTNIKGIFNGIYFNYSLYIDFYYQFTQEMFEVNLNEKNPIFPNFFVDSYGKSISWFRESKISSNKFKMIE